MREGLFKALTALAIGLGGIAWAASADAGETIQLARAWARATPAAAPAGAAFLTVENPGAEADAIVGAAAPVAGVAELHTHAMEGGVMKMRKVERIEVPAHGSVDLKPGGLHVMLIGLKAPLAEGQSFPLVLTFAKAGAVETTVTVEGIGARGPQGGMGAAGHAMPGMPGHAGMK